MNPYSRNSAAISILSLLIFTSCGSFYFSSAQISNPIQHIVVILQENRSFDNYFGTYPGVKGIPSNVCMPYNPDNSTEGCVKPFLTNDPITSQDLPHGFESTVTAIHNGSMNGFMLAENEDPNTMSYFDNSTIPYYWNFASHFVLADNFYSSVLSYSLPNHWYAIAGQAPPTSIYYGLGTGAPAGVRNAYLNESNSVSTVADLLMNSSVTWKYYDFPLSVDGYNQSINDGVAFNYWNPLAAKNSSYTPQYSPHFVSRGNIFSDIGNQTLPQVSWVIPSAPISEHPPANITLGMIWVTDVVDAIMNSAYWQNTAIIITWDDYGGFYDNIVPPHIDSLGYSFRVPAIIISPYAKSGYIDNTQYSFESILRFIEWRFDLPSLTARDANAGNLLNAFNFNQKILSPDLIALSGSELASISPYVGQSTNVNPNPSGTGTATVLKNLRSQINNLSASLNNAGQELSIRNNLLYASIATSILLAAAVAILVIRRPGLKT
ncbi:MAG: phospholipase C [Nitrososphaerales archaeon]